VFVEMVFIDEHKILINGLYQFDGYKATKLMNDFRNKRCTKSSINKLLKKLRDTGTVNKLTAIGRPRSAALKKMLIW